MNKYKQKQENKADGFLQNTPWNRAIDKTIKNTSVEAYQGQAPPIQREDSPLNRITKNIEAIVGSAEIITPNLKQKEFSETSKLQTTDDKCCSVWIGNLDPNLSEFDISHVFSQFGEIESIRLIGSKECAFVNYVNFDDAERACVQMNGVALGSMIIKTDFAKSMGLDYQITAGMDEKKLKESRSVWVGNIGPDCTENILLEKFGRFGKIDTVKILELKNCAFVNYTKSEDASLARIEMQHAKIGDYEIKIGVAKQNPLSSPTRPVKRIQSTTMLEENNISDRSKSLEGENNIVAIRNIYAEWSKGTVMPSKGLTNQILNYDAKVFHQDFSKDLPILPVSLNMSEVLSPATAREYRKNIEHYSTNSDMVDDFTDSFETNILAASVDPVGNILIQKLIEKGSKHSRVKVIHALGKYMATVGIHKNGTWVVQKMINCCSDADEQSAIIEYLKDFFVALMKDQFGNYVVQCCIVFGEESNQTICNALYLKCPAIAMTRFGSRSMRSILESHHLSQLQKQQIALSVIKNCKTLIKDQNGIIILQWAIENRMASGIEKELKGEFAQLCQNKYASVIISKLLGVYGDSKIQKAIKDELFSRESLQLLLRDNFSASILLKALTNSSIEDKLKYAYVIKKYLGNKQLIESPILNNIKRQVEMATSIVHLTTPLVEDSNSLDSGSFLALSNAVGGPVSKDPNFHALSNAKGSEFLNSSISSSKSSYPQISYKISTKPTSEKDKRFADTAFFNLQSSFFGPNLVAGSSILGLRPPTPPTKY